MENAVLVLLDVAGQSPHFSRMLLVPTGPCGQMTMQSCPGNLKKGKQNKTGFP